MQTTCSMDKCTSVETEGCASRDNLCCCRAQNVETVDITCSNPSVLLDPTAMRNETQCSCSPCDDVVIKVRLRVKGQGDDGPIAAAQIFDTDTEEVIGLTLYNGVLDFDVAYTKHNLRFLVQATGYQRVTRTVPLSPRQPTVIVNITMTTLIVTHIGHGDSEIAYPLGKRAWLYAQPGTFHKNGVSHSHDIILKGSYIDSSHPDALEMIESKQFEVDGTLFGMVAAIFLEFEDSEGDMLDVKDLRLVVPMESEEEEDLAEMFVVAHDWETGRWTRVSQFSPQRTKRGKRQTMGNVVAEAPDITTEEFMMIAIPVGAECWTQVRTFDGDMNPFPGPLVSLEQRRKVAGMDILYRFGTDTGGAQTSEESLSSNAVCLPFECNFFLEVSITSRVEPDTRLSPVPLPPGTFPPGDPAIPVLSSDSITFTAIDPADMIGTLSPTYVFREHCVTQALEPNGIANQRDFFSFATDYVPFMPSEDQCYIKVTASNCFFRANIATVITRDAQMGSITSAQVFPQQLMGVPSFGSGFPEECLEYSVQCLSMCTEPQPVCLPFRCGDIIEVAFTSNLTTTGATSDCSLTSVTPVLDNTILAYRGNVPDDSLSVDTSIIDPESFNDPLLGLYFDPQPTRALQLCYGGGVIRDYPTLGGSAAEFGCFSVTTP